MLWYIRLCYVILWYNMTSYVILGCIVLYVVVLCYSLYFISCYVLLWCVYIYIINELWAHIQRDHIQKWTRVKQWNCEARLQKMKGNLPRRPKNMLLYCCYFFIFFSFIFFVYLFLFFYFSVFSMCSYFFHFFKFFSVLEGNWINNWRNIQLAIHKMFFPLFWICSNYFLLCLIIFVYF